jgi:hypothetical protein
MNIQEVKSAINDFRNAFRDDLGAKFVYGKKTSTQSGGFSIDERDTTYEWVDKSSTGVEMYCTTSLATSEELIESGLNQNCTGIVTCIYEDVLSIQPTGTDGQPKIKKEDILDDVILVFMEGFKRYYRIVDFSFAFQLKDSYIFIKFGVVDVEEVEIDGYEN